MVCAIFNIWSMLWGVGEVGVDYASPGLQRQSHDHVVG